MVEAVPEEIGEATRMLLDVATGGICEDTTTALDVADVTGDEATPFDVTTLFTSPTLADVGADGLTDGSTALTEAEVESTKAAALDEVAAGAALELETAPPPTLAQAKLIFVPKHRCPSGTEIPLHIHIRPAHLVWAHICNISTNKCSRGNNSSIDFSTSGINELERSSGIGAGAAQRNRLTIRTGKCFLCHE